MGYEKYLSKGGELLVYQNIPYEIKRVFVLKCNGKIFGGHAHKECHQILIATHGAIEVKIYRDKQWQKIILDDPNKGEHIKPYEWSVQKPLTDQAICLVLCSHNFNEEDYIRDFNNYLKIILDEKQQQ